MRTRRQCDPAGVSCLFIGVMSAEQSSGGLFDVGGGGSRGVQQRLNKRSQVTKQANEAIWALNTLSGVHTNCSVTPNRCRSDAVDRVFDLIQGDPPPDGVPSPKEAFTALLGSKASSYFLEDPCSEAVYDLARLSLPEVAGQCHLSATLSVSELDDLSRFENRLMLDDDSFALRVPHEGRAKIHWSAELQHNYD